MVNPEIRNRAADYWSEKLQETSAFQQNVFWLAIPEVHRRYNAKATKGSSLSWYPYCLQHLTGRLPVERMLSIGCGTGALERDLASLQAFQHCDAYDLAQGAID